MMAASSRDWNVFKQIFADHWEPFQHAHPRYQTAYYDSLVAKMLTCGNPEKIGYSEYRCLHCGQGKHLVAMSCKSSLCLRCAKVSVDNWVSQVSRVLHEGVIYRHIILTVPAMFTHFCPNPDCAYRGWVGWGNLRANGHPNGGPWRQLLCVACRRYFLETLGTLFYGKRVSVELIVRVIACLAEGLGIRGTARVFEVDPNTVLQWLVEAAAQLQAFSRHVLHDVRVQHVQLDELFALLSAVKAGAVSEADAIERLERISQWVWVAMDPESKLLLAIDVGHRTLASSPLYRPNII